MLGNFCFLNIHVPYYTIRVLKTLWYKLFLSTLLSNMVNKKYYDRWNDYYTGHKNTVHVLFVTSAHFSVSASRVYYGMDSFAGV